MRLTRANAPSVRLSESGFVRSRPVGHGQKIPIRSHGLADRKTSCRSRTAQFQLPVEATEIMPGMVAV